VGLAAVDDGDDVRVRELRRRARLAPEPFDVVLVPRVMLVQHLDRDPALEKPVARAVDARHATGTDELLELAARRHATAAAELLELVPIRDHLADDDSGDFPCAGAATRRWPWPAG